MPSAKWKITVLAKISLFLEPLPSQPDRKPHALCPLRRATTISSCCRSGFPTLKSRPARPCVPDELGVGTQATSEPGLSEDPPPPSRPAWPAFDDRFFLLTGAELTGRQLTVFSLAGFTLCSCASTNGCGPRASSKPAPSPPKPASWAVSSRAISRCVPPAKSASATCFPLRLKEAITKSRFSRSAKCAARPRSRNRSIEKPKPAAKPAPAWPRSAAPASYLSRRPPRAPPNATAASSIASAATLADPPRGTGRRSPCRSRHQSRLTGSSPCRCSKERSRSPPHPR